MRPWLALISVLIAGAATACAAIPDVTFVPNDASTADDRSSNVLSDGSTQNPPIKVLEAGDDAAGGDDGGGGIEAESGAPVLDAASPSDAGTNRDAAPPNDDAATSCLPAGAPAGAMCCPNGDPCVGPACDDCTKCQCAVGLYCCAVENGGGKVKSVTCTSNAATCPLQ